MRRARSLRPTSAATAALLLVAAAALACTPPQPPPPADAARDVALDAALPDAPAADAPVDVPRGPVQLTLLTPAALRPALSAYAELVPDTHVVALESPDPLADLAAARGEGLRVAVLADLTCPNECYRLERPDGGAVVHANNALAAQYGVSHLLEGMGYRFFHPLRARVPPAPLALPAATDTALFGPTRTAEQTLRGMQLHTLHPIEGLALWTPSETNLDHARRIIDWLVRNRGNFLQVVALDDIQTNPALAARWREHTRALLAYAHLRGVRLGVNVQLFGTSNLQRAYDLLERPDDPDARAQIRARLAGIVEGLGWDVVALTFGEFSGTSPELFLSRAETVRELLAELAPQAEMSATIHVGNYPDLRVTYRGETMPYYFLVRFLDPRVVPWVHTVMYYTLFDDAGLAYNHDDFGEHRDYLLGRLRTGQRVGYFPESSYWIAFDNSVPTYLPLYTWSRWRDLHEIRARARAEGFSPLREHILFSTGWEWGYWQADAATLRMGFALPDRWEQPIEEMFAPWGAPGAEVARQVARLVTAQRVALIERRLAAYFAGRDVSLDAGAAGLGVVSQPARPHMREVAGMDAAARARFVDTVLTPLEALAAETEAVLRAIEASGADLGDRWLAEVRDGVAVDVLRARFIAAAYRGAVAFGESGGDGGALAQMDALIEQARAVVARRHADLHWPDRRQLVGRWRNPTIFQHGYLHYTESLCYWDRERVELRALVRRTGEELPGCFF